MNGCDVAVGVDAKVVGSRVVSLGRDRLMVVCSCGWRGEVLVGEARAMTVRDAHAVRCRKAKEVR